MLHLLTLVNDSRVYGEFMAHIAIKGCECVVSSLSGAKTIASGYNALAGHGDSDDLLCFVHQDVRFGFDPAKRFKQYMSHLPVPGVLGFCGTKIQEPGLQWWQYGLQFGSVVAGETGENILRFNDVAHGLGDLRYEPIDTMDGFCLCITRSAFDAIGGFDEEYDDWHGYDIDICTKSRVEGFQNYVIAEPIRHFSMGASGPGLDRALARFKKKWGTL